ncbi:MAG: Coenzyme F420 hydrogenase/dehydrogenase, beta subunit C-terminal domain [Candidatus Gastranaerophilales bacterium]|nr:Coenzyme F420 hydrogenase/dehydrogenase, beta subunit C-terminal domain [Candidatus Gastranaerophilales bacterium]
MVTVLETTVKENLCINCGLCKFVCPKDAIMLKPNKYNEYIPSIDQDKCINCGLCAKYCPNTAKKMKEEAKKVSSFKEPHTRGLENANWYVAWHRNEEQRLKCCSGGAVTALAVQLFDKNIIDGMIHVERVWAKKGELHYSARLSVSPMEAQEHVSSAYQPIDFSGVLEKVEKNKTYLITATPCVIRGIKKMCVEFEKMKSIRFLTCALVCSHNTNAQVIDFLTEINELEAAKTENWKINIRHKDNNIQDANNFKNYIYTKDKVLFNENRHKSGWTKMWRRYYFAMNSCLYCSDFWGYEADISVKDAWGKWANDPKGKSIVIIRNKELDSIFKDSNLCYEVINYNEIKNHQKKVSDFKQTCAFDKNFKSIFAWRNKKNDLFKRAVISRSSKILYKKFGYKNCIKILSFINFLCDLGGKN